MSIDNYSNLNTKSERVKLHFAETAKNMILNTGIESVSVRKVAREAGYSFATIYNHFESLDELLWYTRNIMILDIANHIKKNNREKVEDIGGIKKIFRTYVDYFVNNPNVYRFFYFHHLDKNKKIYPSVTEGDEFNSQIVNTFEFLMKSKKYSQEDISKIMKTLIYSIHGLLTLYISDNDDLKLEDVYRDVDDIITLLLSE